ncbi:hypothetical protein JR316_0008845 [Psilocybe cubensis]|uniref:Uncharacterized protein n=2 Tax=Psilocybe cubensis TaxID=181762 RepID=A0ACB8GT31_PSICU|nr:hypothetical protein JR316_0008845 [Psilocybe cubensis]KAH9478391.1 hypothetical protein JR316_0008845 [Psilocybe cubensis]
MTSLSSELSSAEKEWVMLQPLLLSHGYQLPPRYQPNWKPSWEKRWNFKYKTECPDFFPLLHHDIMDAVRVKDGVEVAIKHVVLEEDNVPLLQYLNSPEMLKDSRNNAVRLLDVISVPNTSDIFPKPSVLLVMPKLFPLFSFHLPFRHVREVLDALQQIMEGIVFLHEHRIAHRDACTHNFMMDPTDVIPSGFHLSNNRCQPDGVTRIHFRDRCSFPQLRYYLIDFETAEFFPPNSLTIGRYGQVKDVPEMSETVPYDPFKLDVYQVGSLVKTLIELYEGLDFLVPLRDIMRCPNPELRPTASESLSQLHGIVSQLEQTYLSHEIWLKDSTPIFPKYQTVSPDEKAKWWKFGKLAQLICGANKSTRLNVL